MTEYMIRKMYEAMDKILEQLHPERNEKPLVMIFGGEPLLPPAKDRVKLMAVSCPHYRKHVMTDVELVRRLLELYEQFSEVGIFGTMDHLLLDQFVYALAEKKPLVPRLAFCMAYTSLYVFDVCGYIYPCDGVALFKDYAIGRFLPRLKLYMDKLRMWRRTVLERQKCRNCKYALLCGGGRGYLSLAAGKSLDDPLCPDIEGLVKTIFAFILCHATGHC